MRNATALRVGGTNGVTRCLRRDHDHIKISARHDLAVMHVEAMRERQHGTLLGMRLDVFLVDLCDVLIRQQDHDHVSGFHRVVHFGDLQASLFHFGPGRTALTQADGNLDARLRQILRMRMSL